MVPSALIADRTCRRALRSSMVLASQTVQVTTDAMTSPTMTACTTTSAFINMPHGERSRGSSAVACTGGSSAASTGPAIRIAAAAATRR
jgi:hypothetical protein